MPELAALERRLRERLLADRGHPSRVRAVGDGTYVVTPSGTSVGLAYAISLQTGEDDEEIMNRVGYEELREVEVKTVVDWDKVYGFRVGEVQMVFGRTLPDGTSGPVVYGAALSERELHVGDCGFGATEAQAAADLLRLRRRRAAEKV